MHKAGPWNLPVSYNMDTGQDESIQLIVQMTCDTSTATSKAAEQHYKKDNEKQCRAKGRLHNNCHLDEIHLDDRTST